MVDHQINPPLTKNNIKARVLNANDQFVYLCHNSKNIKKH